MAGRLSPSRPSGASLRQEKSAQGARAKRIRRALAPLRAQRIDIEDLSHRHQGHAGKPDGVEETHLRLRLIAESFAGMGRVARQQRIHRLLQADWGRGLHELSLIVHTPGEVKNPGGEG